MFSRTAAGRREMEAVRRARMERLGLTVSTWPSEEVHALAELLERLNHSLVRPPDET